MALWQTKGLLARAQGKLIKDDPSPFGDTEPDFRPYGKPKDGDNSQAELKVKP